MTLKYGSRRYNKALKELGLTVYKRIDPEGSKWGLYAEYLVAPLIDTWTSSTPKNRKVGWQIYYFNSEFGNTRETMKSYKTKKEAVAAVREQVSREPWYAGLPGYGTARGVYLSDGVYVGGNPRFDR